MLNLGLSTEGQPNTNANLANFILGHAKMAVYVSGKIKLTTPKVIDLTLLFRRMVQAGSMID